MEFIHLGFYHLKMGRKDESDEDSNNEKRGKTGPMRAEKAEEITKIVLGGYLFSLTPLYIREVNLTYLPGVRNSP